MTQALSLDKMLQESFSALPGYDDLPRMKEEAEALAATIKALQNKHKMARAIIQLLEGSIGPQPRDLLSAIEIESTEALLESEKQDEESVDVDVPKSPSGRVQKGIWMSAIQKISELRPTGISYGDIQKELPVQLRKQVELGSTKSFYGSLRRLEETGDFVRFGSHLFTKRGFEEYERSVKLGHSKPVASSKPRSTMGSAIKRILADNGPLGAGMITELLVRNEDFRSSIMRNKSHLYNVLKTLMNREEIERKDGFYILVEAKNPATEVAGS